MYKTDYYGIHENRYRKLKAEGASGWSSSIDNQILLEIIERTFKSEKINANHRILDLGCGNGFLTISLAKVGYQITGIDISTTAIQWAKEKAHEQNLDIDFVEGDACNLPFPDNSFDVVIDDRCLHCIIGDDRKLFLSNANRVLKKGGLLTIMSMCNDPIEEPVLKFYDPESRCMVVNGIAGRYFGLPEDIIAEVVKADFKVRHWEIIPPTGEGQDDLYLVAVKP